MSAGQTVLIVDDDPHIRQVVCFALSRAGYSPLEARDGREALRLFEATSPALVILDVLMPELDGRDVCRLLRARSRVPIVFLSSRDDEVDMIVGLELGGDDYMTKPFSPRELVARVRAVLRRAAPSPTEETAALVCGPLRLDPERHRASWGDRAVTLTATEFALLQALLRRPGKVYSRAELMARVYGDAVVSDRTIDSHVRRVRHKFEAVGGSPIETVHGVGYTLSL